MDKCKADGITDQDEASDAMWEKRQFALKTYIDNNREELESKLTEDIEDAADSSEYCKQVKCGGYW